MYMYISVKTNVYVYTSDCSHRRPRPPSEALETV